MADTTTTGVDEGLMIDRGCLPLAVLAYVLSHGSGALAQDVPGIEICTVEKTMERRTSCLQSNVDFLQKSMTRLALDSQQKLDAVNRQVEGLKATMAALQKTLDGLQAAQKSRDAAPAKETAPAKDGAKDAR